MTNLHAHFCALFLMLWAAGSADAVSMQLVTVGNPGNSGELSGDHAGGYGPDRVCGAIDYGYQIGKFEVTAGQYAGFLNAVARTDTYGLYNPYMWSYPGAGGTECKISRTGTSGYFNYSVAADYANKPVNFVSWGDAARFCNWLANGQPTGLQGPQTTEDGSYALNGATSDAPLSAVTRKPQATYVIPTEDEWYKAAYHKNNGATGDYWDYPTSSDQQPGGALPDTGNNANCRYPGTMPGPRDVGSYVKSPSPYGTYDQAGNLSEWNEAVIFNTGRGVRGGAFLNLGDASHARERLTTSATWESNAVGFRVAYVPEPATLAIAGVLMLGPCLSRPFKETKPNS